MCVKMLLFLYYKVHAWLNKQLFFERSVCFIPGSIVCNMRYDLKKKTEIERFLVFIRLLFYCYFKGIITVLS